MYKIYQDLDGCLVNFDEGFEQLSGGITCEDYETFYGTGEFWKLINKAGEDFWINLEWMPDGKQLWDYVKIYNPIILTAPSSHPTSKIGKQKWMEKHLPGVQMVLSSRKNKQNHAGENIILIDDNHQTIGEWNNAEGIGILHGSAYKTILELEKLGL